jgi:hypothetical protein
MAMETHRQLAPFLIRTLVMIQETTGSPRPAFCLLQWRRGSPTRSLSARDIAFWFFFGIRGLERIPTEKRKAPLTHERGRSTPRTHHPGQLAAHIAFSTHRARLVSNIWATDRPGRWVGPSMS